MTNNLTSRKTILRSGVLAAALLASTAASATEGYFSMGFGPRQSAMGGTGVADSRDAMALALNPAGIAGMDGQFQMGVGLFMPFRGYEATGTGFVAPGDIESDANIFAIPNMAYIRPIDSHSTFGFTLYGNGGMNTTYPNVANTSPGCVGFGGSGVFCGGKAGVDLIQAFLSAGYAYDFGALKVGVAPTLAVQRFKAFGLGAFANPMSSSDPDNVTNNGYDYSVGGGLRGGVEFEVMEGLRLGVSAQTKMWMTEFDKYAGLFAEQGDFDIPASITAGAAFDVTPDLTMTFDYQHIFYSGIDSVANPFPHTGLLGADDGSGFGWEDIDVFKLGVEWRANEAWTLRAGYAYSGNPIGSEDVTLNILAPGIVQHHFTGGLAYKASEANSFEFSAMYVPESTVSGPEVPPPGPPPGVIELNMHQFQVMGGWTHNF